MKHKKVIIPVVIVGIILIGILLFPKEEELYTKPVIEAYQNDELELVDVKQGDLIKKANINLTVQNIGEEQLSFNISDLAYEGIYVNEGDKVVAGQKLAELSPEGKEEFVADSSELELYAPFDGTVTYALDIDEGERSVNNQYVVIINESSRYVISAFTPYWDYFKKGETYNATILGKEKVLTVVDATEVGATKFPDPTEEGASARVYFTLEEEGLLLYSGIPGTLEVVLDERKNVLYIPSNAVNLVNGEEIVYVENADGIRSIHSITTGLDTGYFVEVVDGLSLDDKVIVD